MPGILPMKVIQVGDSTPARIAQACDRCRSKKIRCDGFRPCCSQCANVGFECKTSDKLSRRAFPRGYTESLEERVRALENEVRELKDLLDAKDEKIDVLQRIRQGSTSSRRASDQSSNGASEAKAVLLPDSSVTTSTVEQSTNLQIGSSHKPYFVGGSSFRSLADILKNKAVRTGRPCPDVDSRSIFGLSPRPVPVASLSDDDVKAPPRLVTDQMVNIFFQEWAPLFPILHRPSFLSLYQSYVEHPQQKQSQTDEVQLNLVFGIASLSNKASPCNRLFRLRFYANSAKKRVKFDHSITERHWLKVLENGTNQTSLSKLQCYLLAQIFCLQIGDYVRLNHYRSQSAGMALRLGLNQPQNRFELSTLVCETRKKTFWSLYCLDCFSAAVLGLPVSFNESDVHCEYPVNVDDEFVSEQGIQPVLPGESTKISSALELFKGSRILANVLKQLYPPSGTHELAVRQISTLSEDLDEWLAQLPPHLRLEFTNDKPATCTINSRSPLISLAYHFIRTLIHRPAAHSIESERSSGSTLVIAAASKNMIQILQLLEERNLSFSMCLNRNELIIASGCNLLLQTLDLEKDSMLSKDYQRATCSAIEMLKRAQAPGEPEFRKLACALMAVRRESASSHQKIHMSTASASQSPMDLGISPSDTRETRDVSGAEDTTGRRKKSSSVSAPLSGAVQQHLKRFRPIAPHTSKATTPAAATIASSKASSKTTSLSDVGGSNARSPTSHSRSNPSLNLDFFSFPSDPAEPAPTRNSKLQRRQLLDSTVEETSPGWTHLVASLAGDDDAGASQSPRDETEWPSLNDFRSPLEATGPIAIAASTSPQESWALESTTLNEEDGDEGVRSLSATEQKTQSSLSFSGESVAASEDLAGYDWIADQLVGGFADGAAAVPEEREDVVV